jgi:hypothetical protein
MAMNTQLTCCNAKRVAGVVVAFLCKAINMAAPLQTLAMLPELLAAPRGYGATVACFKAANHPGPNT